ncbi:hypothetical protein EDD18DRAFT_1104420 [Armillaria luteobubalina]|uniref:Uncharacterized protein n=1 Tax=Armillaria luteobubalina TaxID=153913 RepID=A0AA39QAH6_9AGAR|nr:hypothetical protein EDD18DRAFT_1104420 [Armillaria luteobubalina]
MMVSSVGCPCKYHTPEEQRQAHAASSSQCYEWYKASINRDRRRQRRAQRGQQSTHPTPSVRRDTVPQKAAELSITRPTKTLAIMMLDRIAHTNEEFMALIKCQPQAYADHLVRSFFATVTMDTPEGDDSEICEQITKISEFIDIVNKHEATILNAAGVGQELAEAHEYRDCMEEVQKWLEDILCGIMEGIDVLMETHKSRGLLYQNVVHTVT